MTSRTLCIVGGMIVAATLVACGGGQKGAPAAAQRDDGSVLPFPVPRIGTRGAAC